jgi:hypothetical protein
MRIGLQADGMALEPFLAFMFLHRQQNLKRFEKVEWKIVPVGSEVKVEKKRPVKGVRPVSGTRMRSRRKCMQTHPQGIAFIPAYSCSCRHPTIHRRVRVPFPGGHSPQANREGRRGRSVTLAAAK